MVKNKIKNALLLAGSLLCPVSFGMTIPRRMIRTVDEIVHNIALHHKLSSQESARLQETLRAHEAHLKPEDLRLDDRSGIEITPQVLDYILPFIKKANDPFLIKRLFRAILDGQEDLVRMLIEQAGVSVNAQGKLGTTFLRKAVMKEDVNFDIVRYLLEQGADVNAIDPLYQDTPLGSVASSWYIDGLKMERARILLEYGARTTDVNTEHEDVLTIAEREAGRGLLFRGGKEDLVNLTALIAEIEQDKKEGIALTGALPEALDGLLPTVLHPEVGKHVNWFYGWQDQ